MTWRRRQYRAGERPEHAFKKRLGYEIFKEIGGVVFQYTGMGVGALAGLAGSVLGLPATASVITGTVVGTSIGAVGKAYLNARMDTRREQAEQQPKVAMSTQPTKPISAAPVQRSGQHTADSASGFSSGPRRRWSGRNATSRAGNQQITGPSSTGGMSPMKQFIGKLEQVITEVEQASGQLNALMTQMWESQHRIFSVLAGGRPDVIRRTHDQADGARLRVQDAATLSRQAAENLRVYRAGL